MINNIRNLCVASVIFFFPFSAMADMEALEENTLSTIYSECMWPVDIARENGSLGCTLSDQFLHCMISAPEFSNTGLVRSTVRMMAVSRAQKNYHFTQRCLVHDLKKRGWKTRATVKSRGAPASTLKEAAKIVISTGFDGTIVCNLSYELQIGKDDSSFGGAALCERR